MSQKRVILPGDSDIISETIEDSELAVKLGPNIFHNPVTSPVPVTSGYLSSKKIKNGSILYVESSSKRVCTSLSNMFLE